MKEETKGLYAAILLSVLIIYGVNYFLPANPTYQEMPVSNQETAAVSEENIQSAQPESSIEPVENDPRVEIVTPSLKGSINLRGARLDDLKLTKYKETLAADSPEVQLLYPTNSQFPYFSESGWISTDASIKLPDAKTIWTTEDTVLSPKSPLTLEYDNQQGLRFIRVISVDENYLFTIQDTVENNSSEPVVLFPYGLISRTVDEASSGSRSVVHEGMSGVIDGSLHEFKLKDIKKKKPETFESNQAWAGFTDRYWFTALIPDNMQENDVKFAKTAKNIYQVDYRSAPVTIASHSATTKISRFFAGAKEIKLLDAYTDNQNIEKFDLAVDFGWYYFLTKPFFYILDFLYNIIGNMGWAILLFAALLRLCMFPIANKSYESMSKMKKMQPKIKELQDKYKGNPQLLQQATMELYRREKINPASGCLPMFIQIPVFFSLYKVLNISIEIRHAPFIGWIHDLSAPDPLTISVWSHLPVPAFLNIGVWPIVMGITMWIQQKLNPAPANKDQARMFAMLPLIFMFMMGHFASGLVIYWTLNNILSIIQQRAIMIKNGVK